MTSTPITASAMFLVSGAAQAGTSLSNDVENSFSDVLKSQGKSEETAKPESSASATRVNSRTDKVSKAENQEVTKADKTELSAEEEIEMEEKMAEEVAGEIVEKVAAELGITEEEVIQVLDELSMKPLDLLQTENLQKFVLAVAGESDACSMVTNEELFQNFKNLNEALTDVVAEVSEETGLEEEKVREILTNLMDEVNASEVETEAEPVDTFKVKGEDGKLHVETEDDTEKAEHRPDGAKIMLERSMQDRASNDMAGNASADTANPFTTNGLNAQFTGNVQNASEVFGFMDTNTQMIMDQITEYMNVQVGDGLSEIEMQLHPESLGSLHVRLTSKEGIVTAQFTAQNDTVKTAIESQMIQLKEVFQEKGVSVEAIEVTVESHRFDQQFNQGQSQAGSDERQPKRMGIRRINLDVLADDEELSEEEQLAAEMLKQSGGTVDYTV